MPEYAANPRARFDYEILETLEAGLVLAGHEVKAIKNGKVSIRGAYVRIIGNGGWLVGAVVSPYQPGNPPAGGLSDYDSQRSRKLLLKKSELKYLIGKSQERGLTLVPLRLYSKGNLVKLEIGVGRGKKKYDKREAIKKREFERKISRLVK